MEVAWTPFALDPETATISGETFEVWANNVYTVLKRKVEPAEGWPELIHLSIRRNDRQVIDDWRDKQRIKNLLVGPENEAVELYPAESRLVDAANQFHLWVIANPEHRFPVGYQNRVVSEAAIQLDGHGQSQQRPFPSDYRPDDLVDQTIMDSAKRLIEMKRAGVSLPEPTIAQIDSDLAVSDHVVLRRDTPDSDRFDRLLCRYCGTSQKVKLPAESERLSTPQLAHARTTIGRFCLQHMSCPLEKRP